MGVHELVWQGTDDDDLTALSTRLSRPLRARIRLRHRASGAARVGNEVRWVGARWAGTSRTT